jgi:sterol O-acyltransferase
LYASSKGFLRWNKGGMLIQSIFQFAWLLYWVSWPFVRTWTWTAQVFFTLHLLALFMKMHSYAFYNGHLSETLRRLNALDKPEGVSRAAARRYPKSTTRLSDLPEEADEPPEPEKEVNGNGEQLDHLREDLAFELTSNLGHITYPQNLTVLNFTDFLFCPTLCYELEYPRTSGTNWLELFYKTLAVFGCIFLLTITSEQFIIPVLAESGIRMRSTTFLPDRILIMAETTSSLLFPFMVTFLLVFLVIFEYLLGAFAEITCFADRHFYADWWNSCDWLEFSREWNIPVHHFFRRHVYSASRGHVSRPVATVITFLISALAHELVMGCITKKLRGYGFFAMMLQMPLVMIQRSEWVRGRTLLNNVLFWCSMILGLSMVSAYIGAPFILYLTDIA